MKKTKVIAVLLVVLMAAAVFMSGCGSAQVLAATVGDREITVQQLETSYSNASSYASYYGYSLDTDEGIASFVEYLLDGLVTSEMKIYQAKLAGVTLTDEEEASAEETAQSNYDDTYQSFIDQATSAGASNVNAYAKTLFTDALVSNNTTVRKLKASMLEQAEDDLLVSKHEEQLLDGVELTSEELLEKYDEELASQKELFDETPSMYFTYESYASYGYYAPPLYVPDGFFRVRQILVDDEATALEVKEKLDAGEDFETLLAEYNTDPGMDSDEYADGYLVGDGANYVDEFLDAALALENDGDVSDPVESDYGWHIIKRVSTESAHEIPYADVQETLDAYLQTQYQTDYYQDIVDGWVADESLVTTYPENYASVGLD
ncbi:MAG TPA: peptidylprolyl isomerase [Eubacteriales bacterium]|nr:peptidylprolyl isomerase [Eubacteriales bacterium]